MIRYITDDLQNSSNDSGYSKEKLIKNKWCLL